MKQIKDIIRLYMQNPTIIHQSKLISSYFTRNALSSIKTQRYINYLSCSLFSIFKGRFRLISKTITVIKNLPRTLVFIAKCCNSCLSCRRSNPWTNNSRDVCYLRVVISSMKSTQVEELMEAGKHSK